MSEMTSRERYLRALNHLHKYGSYSRGTRSVGFAFTSLSISYVRLDTRKRAKPHML